MKDKDMLNNDYTSFKNSQELGPNSLLRDSILNHVKEDLSVDHKAVFIKTLLIQAFIGVLTLLFCPQFEMSLTNNFELFHLFHHSFGSQVCMMICGSIFIGTGALFASSILRTSELQLITKNKFLYLTFISGFLITGLLLFGAEIFLAGLFFWLLGAFISGSLVYEGIYLLKSRIIN
jgi:hypothetical protein